MEQLKQISGIEKAVAEMAAEVTGRKKALKHKLAPYVKGVVTEETLDGWKKDRATLNKERTAAEKERTALEASWKDKLKPISEAYKDIKYEYDVAINSIDAQTKIFEEKRLKEKRALINNLFAEYEAPELVAGWLTLADIYDSKWENKTCKDKDILRDIETAYTKLHQDAITLMLSKSEYEKEGLEVLRATRDLGKAFQKIAEMQEQAKRILEQLEAEQRRKEEEARRKAEEEQRQKQLEEQRRLEEEQRQKELEEQKKLKEEQLNKQLEEFAKQPVEVIPVEEDIPVEWEVEKVEPQKEPELAFGTPEFTEETHKYMIMISTVTELTAAELEDTKRSLYRLGFNVLSTERI